MLPYLKCPLVFVAFPEFLKTSKYGLQRIKPFDANFLICFTTEHWERKAPEEMS